MNIKKSIAIALISLGLSLAGQSSAELGPVVSQAYEVGLENFRAPTTANGGVAFQECDECERMTVRVTSGTRYTVNGKAVRLEDFRKALSQARDRESVGLTVLHHLESDTIELIAVSL